MFDHAYQHGPPNSMGHRREALGVTLVVPLRNEEHTVEALVRSIERQTLSPDTVILVDAGSRDGTRALAMKACSGHPNWSVVCAGAATPGRARNVGIEAATTEWVALTDAGIDLDPHWLERLTRVALAQPEVEVVWGHYEPAPDGWFTDCARLAYVGPPRGHRLGPVRDSCVPSSLLRRRAWERAGRFPDLRAAEDRIFMRRLRELETPVAVAPEAVVWWHLQNSLRGTFRRFRLYSRVNALANEQRYWHYGVARMYLLASPFLVLAAVSRRRWAVVPLLGGAGRVGRSIWKAREGRTAWWALNPARLATVAAILAVVDAATFTGWLEAAFSSANTPPA